MYHDSLDDFRRTFLGALAEGAERQSFLRATWDVAGRCQSPVGVEVMRRPSTIGGEEIRPGSNERFPLILNLETRCRKCPPCLKARAGLWAGRAIIETKTAFRTWFGTLTLSPEWQVGFLAKARKREINNGVDFETLSDDEQFRCRAAAMAEDITLYWKRVRKASGAPIRFLMVCEAHQSGDPHFHVLVHETSLEEPCRKVHLRDQWKFGFTKWKLIETTDGRHAWYVCKYLAKSNLARVRASLHYGNPPGGIERVFQTVRETYDLQEPQHIGTGHHK